MYIAGTVDQLDGAPTVWNPADIVLTRAGATISRIVLTGREGAVIRDKYTTPLGRWTSSRRCSELGNRQLMLTYRS